ncbi:cell division cycle-associated protein 7 [Acyrthosiphon pisum]|uniref:Zinc-finger domain-containing protein n=1 Tax=Acyrthosiphon pisum TaxID=7029 RepID=A0A8R1W6W5_ACYPI|nr:cell division cycle-associated protein 7 [Acyrthosiphon pisum]|eukprot:XP_003245746.1 PREDICTED: cell division cycle-associated protein 7 [Acyrthosiphon pisum]
MSAPINEGASTSAGLSEYELLRQENMNKLKHEVGDIFSNALQCAQNLKKKLRLRSGRRAAHIPGLRVKLFSKLEKSSKAKEAQRKDIRRSSRSKRKQIYYDSKDENNNGKNKKCRQKLKQQKKCPSPKSKVSKRTFSRKVSRLDASLVTKEMIDNINYRSVGKKYSTDKGTTCHQCRQKTLDQKSYCRHQSCKGMRGMFCGFCLGKRYGEDVAEALLNPVWACPPCRGQCNCSICRRHQGKDPTGQMAQEAKAKGYNSVCDMLRTIEGDPCEPQNHNPVENHIELQNSNVVSFTGTQLKNDVAVFDEHKSENKVKNLKSISKDEEQCNSKNYIEEQRETSEMVIDKLYEKLMAST